MLPFDLALVNEINPSGIVEVPAPPAESADSWFPDYAWSHYVLCTASGGSPTHLGWRFSRKAGALGAGPESFVALIVRASDREAEPAAAGRANVPLSAGVAEKSDEAAAALEELVVGEPAPGWMVAMLAAVTAGRVQAS